MFNNMRSKWMTPKPTLPWCTLPLWFRNLYQSWWYFLELVETRRCGLDADKGGGQQGWLSETWTDDEWRVMIGNLCWQWMGGWMDCNDDVVVAFVVVVVLLVLVSLCCSCSCSCSCSCGCCCWLWLVLVVTGCECGCECGGVILLVIFLRKRLRSGSRRRVPNSPLSPTRA